jgi:hypothetical protein
MSTTAPKKPLVVKEETLFRFDTSLDAPKLHFTEDGLVARSSYSDQICILRVLERSDGFAVETRTRRGSHISRVPEGLAAAERVFAGRVKAKKKDGYRSSL